MSEAPHTETKTGQDAGAKERRFLYRPAGAPGRRGADGVDCRGLATEAAAEISTDRPLWL
jgi:hypothetical protein